MIHLFIFVLGLIYMGKEKKTSISTLEYVSYVYEVPEWDKKNKKLVPLNPLQFKS